MSLFMSALLCNFLIFCFLLFKQTNQQRLCFYRHRVATAVTAATLCICNWDYFTWKVWSATTNTQYTHLLNSPNSQKLKISDESALKFIVYMSKMNHPYWRTSLRSLCKNLSRATIDVLFLGRWIAFFIWTKASDCTSNPDPLTWAPTWWDTNSSVSIDLVTGHFHSNQVNRLHSVYMSQNSDKMHLCTFCTQHCKEIGISMLCS